MLRNIFIFGHLVFVCADSCACIAKKRVLFGYKNLNQKNESQVKIHNVQIDNNQTTFAADTLDELVELVRAKLHRFVFHPPRSAKLQFSPECLRITESRLHNISE